MLLNVSLLSRIGLGDSEGLVRAGRVSDRVYVPVNGIFTRGYPDETAGDVVSDLRWTLAVPLLRINGGIGAFPLFFRDIQLSPYVSHSIVDGSIRTSAGGELTLRTVLGYDIPFDLTAGYVHAFSTGGKSGLYLSGGAVIGF
jgi:hypothetical protein